MEMKSRSKTNQLIRVLNANSHLHCNKQGKQKSREASQQMLGLKNECQGGNLQQIEESPCQDIIQELESLIENLDIPFTTIKTNS